MPKITIEIDLTEKQLNTINKTVAREGYVDAKHWCHKTLSLEIQKQDQGYVNRMDILLDVLSISAEKANSSIAKGII